MSLVALIFPFTFAEPPVNAVVNKICQQFSGEINQVCHGDYDAQSGAQVYCSGYQGEEKQQCVEAVREGCDGCNCASCPSSASCIKKWCKI